MANNDYLVMRDVPATAAAWIAGSHIDGEPKYRMVRDAIGGPAKAVVNGVEVTVTHTIDLFFEIHVDRRNQHPAR